MLFNKKILRPIFLEDLLKNECKKIMYHFQHILELNIPYFSLKKYHKILLYVNDLKFHVNLFLVLNFLNQL